MEATVAIVALSLLNLWLVVAVYELAKLVKARDLVEYRNEKHEEPENPYKDPMEALDVPFDPLSVNR